MGGVGVGRIEVLDLMFPLPFSEQSLRLVRSERNSMSSKEIIAHDQASWTGFQGSHDDKRIVFGQVVDKQKVAESHQITKTLVLFNSRIEDHQHVLESLTG